MGAPFVPPAPHIVILGAGASKAAFCSGDREGKLIPRMDQIPSILSPVWQNLLNDAKPPVSGFEPQFSWLRAKGEYKNELDRIELEIVDYFSSLELPDHPTIYDYLVLGLRPKDLVATFNWDPLLLLAHSRNRGVVELPDIRFLHGCVHYATCAEHDVLGRLGEACPICSRPLRSGRLFFPDFDKDYTQDSLVQRDWDVTVERLKKAFHLTIFGYSGPATDYKARELLLSGWGETPLRSVSHIEIIDIEKDEVLRERWKEFIPFQHDMVTPDYWCSTIAHWPRRTGEYKLSASLYGIPSEEIGPIHTKFLSELQDWHRRLGDAEFKTNDAQQDAAEGQTSPGGQASPGSVNKS